VFSQARNSTPRDIPQNMQANELVGNRIEIAPNDYGLTPVTGVVAGADQTRTIVARETEEFGTIHVHFPHSGYEISILE
jgi:hypothetical protein